MQVTSTRKNRTEHEGTVDAEDIRRAIGEMVIRKALGALPPDGQVSCEVKYSINDNAGVLSLAGATVVAIVDHEAPASPGVVAWVYSRQAHQALILRGLDGAVNAAIDAIPDDVQRKLMRSWFEKSLTFERARPEIAQMAAVLQWDEAFVDELFAFASTL